MISAPALRLLLRLWWAAAGAAGAADAADGDVAVAGLRDDGEVLKKRRTFYTIRAFGPLLVLVDRSATSILARVTTSGLGQPAFLPLAVPPVIAYSTLSRGAVVRSGWRRRGGARHARHRFVGIHHVLEIYY